MTFDLRRFALKLGAVVLAWQVIYFAWFVVTGDIHAMLDGMLAR